MTNYLSADDFLAGITGHAVDFTLEGVGTVRLRGLTALEMSEFANMETKDMAAQVAATNRLVAYGLVEPKLSAEQVDALSKAQALFVKALSDRIQELSVGSEKKADGDGS